MKEDLSPKVIVTVVASIVVVLALAVYWFFLKPAKPGIDITVVPKGAGTPIGWGPPPGSNGGGQRAPGVKPGTAPPTGANGVSGGGGGRAVGGG